MEHDQDTCSTTPARLPRLASEIRLDLLWLELSALLLASPSNARADQVPPGCAGGDGPTLSIQVLNGSYHHVGDPVDFQVGLALPSGQCQSTNLRSRLTFPDGTRIDWITVPVLNPGTTITCPNPADPRCLAGPYRYVVRSQDIGGETCETGLPNVSCCSPSAPDAVYVLATLSGISQTGPGPLNSPFSSCKNIGLSIIHSSLSCSVSCMNGVGPTGAIAFNGSVSCIGNAPLAPVTVSNFVNSELVLVTNVSSMSPGDVVSFSSHYVPANPFLPATSTILVTGVDPLGATVSSTGTSTCSNLMPSASSMFRTPKRLADGTVELALDCVPGTTYLIQASSNFVVWETISTTNVSSSPVSCTDTNAARVARRFYRASSAATP